MKRLLSACFVPGLAVVCLIAMGGCGSSVAPPPLVWITRARGLAPPPVSIPFLYAPGTPVAIDPDLPDSPRAYEFFIDAVTSSTPGLRLRLVDPSTGNPVDIDALEDTSSDTGASPWVLSEHAREALRAGSGAFWFQGAGDAFAEHVLAVAIPETLLAGIVRVQVVLSDENGNPLASDEIEIAPSFFNMAVIGDSVLWGNGLTDRAKFSTQVAAEIQRRTGRRVIRQVQAISGTTIVPPVDEVICTVSCNGEAQTANTSITHQADLIENMASMDLVLMDGCINDVGVAVITDPNSAPADIAASTQQFCGQEMQSLLAKVRTLAPQATIVITGYYPIVSAESTLPELISYLFTQGKEDASAQVDVVSHLAENAGTFFEVSRDALAGAVASEEALHPDVRTLFVDPAFTSANAIFASAPLLWGLSPTSASVATYNQDLDVFPEDLTVEARSNACFAAELLVDPVSCLYASVGHPNVAGAQQYATAILSSLVQAGVLPP